ncbi:MAG: DsbA family protein [Gemmatimonadota bacterium]
MNTFDAMSRAPIRIYFDFVDPLSYVAAESFRSRSRGTLPDPIEWIGFELRPPPARLTTGDDPLWVARREAARPSAEALNLALETPALVPWTRKAHELHLHAASHDAGAAVRHAVFEAFFRDGLDIGRVDVLVQIAIGVGLDRTEAKAVLDVDRHQADVAAARAEAQADGVTDVPCHSVDGMLVEGFPDPTDLGTLLPDE